MKSEIPRYKLLILGESNVGKTSIMNRFISDTFSKSAVNTVGINFSSKEITINGKSVKLQIWDTAGQEKFHSITKSYYRNANGIFLVFSMTDQRSFDSIDHWFKTIKTETENIPLFLIGNKSDLSDEDPALYVEKAKKYNVEYYSTSALENLNIDQIFIKMTETMMKKDKKNKSNPFSFKKIKRPNCC